MKSVGLCCLITAFAQLPALSQVMDSESPSLHPALATPNANSRATRDVPMLEAQSNPLNPSLTTATPTTQPASSPSATTTSAPSSSAAATKVSMPKRLAGCLAGTFVGIPVCMVRRSKYEDWYAVHGMIGDSDNKFARITLGALWYPFAVVTGVCESPADGTINAVRNSSKPFSKDQFSLGVLKQNHE